jgi:N-acetylglucosaminyl-diphospho-decaprenol L-rhamnosyltransferase
MMQLCAESAAYVARVVLTHNLPAEPVKAPEQGWPFHFTEVFNEQPRGFGSNHNRAFAHCNSELFCVMNPDIELIEPDTMAKMLRRVQDGPDIGCAYPVLFNPDGTVQQNEREIVTPLALVRRHLLRMPQRWVDWVSGAFWLVPAKVWRTVGGFDERFFMYCEDTEFCLRLQLAGWTLARADARAVHDASWASRRLGKPMAWHLRSLMRLWSTNSYHQYLTRGREKRREVRPTSHP